MQEIQALATEAAPQRARAEVRENERNRCGCNKSSSCLQKWHSAIQWYQRVLERGFAFTSRHIARHPWFTIFGSLFIVCCCSLGILWIKLESRADKLFVPEGNQATLDLQIVQKYFRMKMRNEIVIFTPKTGKNIFSTECFKEILKVHQAIVDIPPYLKHCVPIGGVTAPNRSDDCLASNPLEMFQFKEENLVNIQKELTKKYFNKLTPFIMRNGRPAYANFPAMFGALVINATTQEVVSAEAVQIVYSLRDPVDYEGNDALREWEGKFLKLMKNFAKNLECMNVFYSATRSLDDAVSESSTSDLGLVTITFVIMNTFACLMMAKFRNPLTGHALLGTAGIFAVILGITAGFGIVVFAGTPFISMVGVLPFLIVGIGIDDMFILVDALDRHDTRMTVVDTVRTVMSHTGVTITMTTVTDLVAFVISTSTQFPSVRYFCIYAAVAITCAYLLIVTLFVACMTLDVKRIKAGRRDLLPVCFVPQALDNARDWQEPSSQFSSKIMALWARFLVHPVTKGFVVVLSFCLLASGVYGTINIDEHFDRYVLAKHGTYWRDFFTVQDKYFIGSISVSLVITEPIDYRDPGIQREILKLSDIAAENKLYTNASVSWLKELDQLAKRHSGQAFLNGTNFMTALQLFLSNPTFSHFKEDVKLSADGHSIKASRVIVFMKATTDSIVQKDAMLTLRNDLAQKSKLPVRATSFLFQYFEQYAITRRDTIRNLSLAAGTVLLITYPFLANFSVTLLIFFGFVSLIFELFGMMYIWDVSLNSVSMIILIMAVGLSVDYSAHIAHAYLLCDKKSPDERIEHALKTVGVSVIMGGASTFLGVVVTAFASSEIFFIFFRMFFGIVVLGLLHGLCFLPVYLSITGRCCLVAVETRVLPVDINANGSPSEANNSKGRSEVSAGSSSSKSNESQPNGDVGVQPDDTK